jgi:O-antigen/teichoic acid export membrane protein
MSSAVTTSAPPRMWRSLLHRLRRDQTNTRVLGGSLMMLVGFGLVSAINFGYNVAVARMLGPAAFGHAAAAVTMLMLLSALTLAFQLVCAKFVARNETAGARAAVYRTLKRKAWYMGVALGSFLVLASTQVATYLHWPSSRLVVLLAFGITFYIPLGVKRGGLQGTCSFSRLTANFLTETVVKFITAVATIHFGFGVEGAVAAISVSVIIAYFLPPVPKELHAPSERAIPASFHEGMQAIVFFVGQVIINNIDILLVKHFFDPSQAGVYAAIALVGRVVYMLSWSVVSAMFPISAASAHREEDRPAVLVVPLLLVLGIALTFTVTLSAFPNFAVRAMFGAGFHASHGVDSLLAIYAAATGLYSLAMVLMAYEMSRKIANSGFVQLLFSGAIFLGIVTFHRTLRQVVIVQLVLMVFLLIAAAVPFFRLKVRARSAAGPLEVAPLSMMQAASTPISLLTMKRLRRVPEAEVIAGFLRNEFYHREFSRDSEQFRELVMNPDLTNDAENALRRALLFRRRATMWHELPPDTQWYEVQLTREDLEHMYVFPRAHWRKLADGNFRMLDMVERMRTMPITEHWREFMQKIHALSAYLKTQHDESTILLITVDESHPMTLIEGNHRVTAALLAGPDVALSQFRWLCGFSPHMAKCCWYQTNFGNLSRYAMKRLRLMAHDGEDDIQRLLSSRRTTNVLESVNEPAARKTA